VASDDTTRAKCGCAASISQVAQCVTIKMQATDCKKENIQVSAEKIIQDKLINSWKGKERMYQERDKGSLSLLTQQRLTLAATMNAYGLQTC
jgi:hypothetical protein